MVCFVVLFSDKDVVRCGVPGILNPDEEELQHLAIAATGLRCRLRYSVNLRNHDEVQSNQGAGR